MQSSLQIISHLRICYYSLQGSGHIINALAGGRKISNSLPQISSGFSIAIKGCYQNLQTISSPHQAARHVIQILSHLANISLINLSHIGQGCCQAIYIGSNIAHIHRYILQGLLCFLISQQLIHGIQQCLYLQNSIIHIGHHIIHSSLLQTIDKILWPIAILKIGILIWYNIDKLASHNTIGSNSYSGFTRNLYLAVYMHSSHYPNTRWLHTIYLAYSHTGIAYIIAGGQSHSLRKSYAKAIALTAT